MTAEHYAMALTNADDACKEYIDCVIDPLKFHDRGYIPDGYNQPVCRLMDYYDFMPFATPATTTNTFTFTSIGFYMTYGQNAVSNSVVTTGATSATTNPLWTFVWFYVGTNGAIITTANLTLADEDLPLQFRGSGYLNAIKEDRASVTLQYNNGYDVKEVDDVGATTGTWFSPGTVNYNSITGSSTNSGYNNATGLAQAIRLNSAGFSVWPTIEVATDSSTLYVQQYYGCQMAANTLAALRLNSSVVLTAMKEANSFRQYSNFQGISARIDPCQEGIYQLTQMQSLSNLNSGTLSTDNMVFPLVLVQFTAAQTQAISTANTLPINVMLKFNFEALLRTPTPIVSVAVPLSLQWKQCLEIVRFNDELFPLITTGHSFKRLGNIFRRVAKTAVAVAKNPTVQAIAKSVIRSNPVTQSLYENAREIVTPIVKIARSVRGSRKQSRQRGQQPKQRNKPKQKKKGQGRGGNAAMRNSKPTFKNQRNANQSMARHQSDLQRLLPGRNSRALTLPPQYWYQEEVD